MLPLEGAADLLVMTCPSLPFLKLGKIRPYTSQDKVRKVRSTSLSGLQHCLGNGQETGLTRNIREGNRQIFVTILKYEN